MKDWMAVAAMGTLFETDATHPLVENAIRTICEAHELAPRREIVDAILSDPTGKRIAEAARAKDPEGWSVDRIAGNMVDWFSAKFTQGHESVGSALSDFGRLRDDDGWIYFLVDSQGQPMNGGQYQPDVEVLTERLAMATARIGQQRFRTGLLRRHGSCQVTGCSSVAVLRASHIKPWAACTDDERLDLDNGLLLAAHLDACFDAGLITFGAQGQVAYSSSLPSDDRSALNLSDSLQLRDLNQRAGKFLEFHRQNVFH